MPSIRFACPLGNTAGHHLDNRAVVSATVTVSLVTSRSGYVPSSPGKSKLFVFAVTLIAVQCPGFTKIGGCLIEGDGSLLGNIRTASGSKSSFGFSSFFRFFSSSSRTSSSDFFLFLSFLFFDLADAELLLPLHPPQPGSAIRPMSSAASNRRESGTFRAPSACLGILERIFIASFLKFLPCAPGASCPRPSL